MPASYEPAEIRGREVVDVVAFDTSLAPDESITFQYYVKTESDLVQVTRKIAEEETTGRWVGRGEPTDTFRAARAEPVELRRYDANDGVVTVRSPLANVDFDAEF